MKRGGNLRLFDVEFVNDVVKLVVDLVQPFNQLQNVGLQVGQQVLRIEVVFDVAAQLVRFVFDSFYLLVDALVFVPAVFI